MAIWKSNTINALALITLLQISGCNLSKKVNLDGINWKSDRILCSSRPNKILPSEDKTSWKILNNYNKMSFHFQITYAQDLNLHQEKGLRPDELIINLKAQDFDQRKPEFLIGEQLRIEDTFTYEGVTWKIIRVGKDGIAVEGEEICRYGFMHIQPIYP